MYHMYRKKLTFNSLLEYKRKKKNKKQNCNCKQLTSFAIESANQLFMLTIYVVHGGNLCLYTIEWN